LCDIEIIDERLRRYEILDGEPEITKEDIIQRQIDDWRYIDEDYMVEIGGCFKQTMSKRRG